MGSRKLVKKTRCSIMSSQFSSRKHWTPKELRNWSLLIWHTRYLNHGKEESRSFHGDFSLFSQALFHLAPSHHAIHRRNMHKTHTSAQSPHCFRCLTQWAIWPNLHETWNSCHFFDKMAWTASIFMTRWHETGLHSFLWQDGMRQDCIHFYDKPA